MIEAHEDEAIQLEPSIDSIAIPDIHLLSKSTDQEPLAEWKIVSKQGSNFFKKQKNQITKE